MKELTFEEIEKCARENGVLSKEQCAFHRLPNRFYVTAKTSNLYRISAFCEKCVNEEWRKKQKDIERELTPKELFVLKSLL